MLLISWLGEQLSASEGLFRYCKSLQCSWCCDRAVGWRYRSNPGRDKSCCLLHTVRTGSGAHTKSYSVSSGVKWPGRETDHSFASSAEVENEWRCAYIACIWLQGVQRATVPLHSSVIALKVD